MGQNKHTVSGLIAGVELLREYIADLIGRGAWFSVEPRGGGDYFVTVTSDNQDVFAKDYPDAYYLMDGGMKCPVCESENVEGVGGGFDVDGTEASNNIACLDCNASWSDIYKLIGYTNLQK